MCGTPNSVKGGTPSVGIWYQKFVMGVPYFVKKNLNGVGENVGENVAKLKHWL